jgi:pyridoxine 5-phosphate synthase
MPPTRLSVNVDHIATLRQARGVDYPDPLAGAKIAESVGAHGITVHIRLDRRHIQETDVTNIRREVRGKLNLEMCTAEEMVAIALGTKPHQVTLVPERPGEVTTEGGLDLGGQLESVREVATRLGEAGISTSLFLDPDPAQIAALSELGPGLVPGFEINTDAYTRAATADREAELAAVRDAAEAGAAAGFQVFAGHGLTTDNVGPVAALPEVEELNIGHSIVSRAVLVGMNEAVREMLEALDRASTGAAG